jgi:heme-degrading monooxygenase HmoA
MWAGLNLGVDMSVDTARVGACATIRYESVVVVIWEFYVKAGCEVAFESLYGPCGEWVQLFRLASGFHRTELLKDHANRSRYLTLDYWTSVAEYDAFRSAYAAQFRDIDAKGETLTERESPIGSIEAAWDRVA